MNPTHRDPLKMCVYPSAGIFSLSHSSPVLWPVFNMLFTHDTIFSVLFSFVQFGKRNHFIFLNYSFSPRGMWVGSFPPTNM